MTPWGLIRGKESGVRLGRLVVCSARQAVEAPWLDGGRIELLDAGPTPEATLLELESVLILPTDPAEAVERALSIVRAGMVSHSAGGFVVSPPSSGRGVLVAWVGAGVPWPGSWRRRAQRWARVRLLGLDPPGPTEGAYEELRNGDGAVVRTVGDLSSGAYLRAMDHEPTPEELLHGGVVAIAGQWYERTSPTDG